MLLYIVRYKFIHVIQISKKLQLALFFQCKKSTCRMQNAGAEIRLGLKEGKSRMMEMAKQQLRERQSLVGKISPEKL